MPEPRRTVRSRERRNVKGTASPARWGSALDAHATARQREAEEMAAMVMTLLVRLSTGPSTDQSTEKGAVSTGTAQATDAPIEHMRSAA